MTTTSHGRRALAIHEAAHAVVGEALTFVNIEVDLCRWRGGATFERGFGPEMWRRDLLVSLAGEAAQRRVDIEGVTLLDERGNLRAADDMRKVDVAVSRFNHHDDLDVEDRNSEARIADGKAATDQLLDLLWPAVEAVGAAIEAGGGTVAAMGFQRVLDAAMSRDKRAQAVEQIEFIRRPFNAA
jgi:hypothetical protein